MEAQAGSRLVLTWQQRRVCVSPDERIVIGRSQVADMNVDRELVSREHLHIFMKDHYFVVLDTSTNGTYIQSEDNEVNLCKRRESRLCGQGWLALGEPPQTGIALHFQHVRATSP